tara:strand:+ start:608 stop:832 length:225 start_codon:yes stop_codon:yes gene_type:complete
MLDIHKTKMNNSENRLNIFFIVYFKKLMFDLLSNSFSEAKSKAVSPKIVSKEVFAPRSTKSLMISVSLDFIAAR